ncbi:Gfo/Idh/MocA family protein [Jiangella muralis]|uniref:Gfo/Idh/MocA family protein n=1 Tax=Jiangella muralis TaxID=702383 RepID=UPI00069F59B1|nr:Gfo/Idh/MocA family oxidoreductase [Jiangella muralis]
MSGISGTNAWRPRVALVGLAGYGATHVRTARELQAAGVLEIVAGADLDPDASRELPEQAEFSTDYRAMLGSTRPDVTVIATPPHTHAEIAAVAARAGSDILLEKPPLVSRAEHDELARILDRTGIACQVGFQTLVSPAMRELLRLCAAGGIGRLTEVTATGGWVRTSGYYDRAAWAGHRVLGGRVVADGVATNPFAHVVMNVLEIVAAARPGAEPRWLEAETYRCADIDTDDTACIRLGFDDDVTAVIALTLRADTASQPRITVRGSLADVTYTVGSPIEIRAHAADTDPVATPAVLVEEAGAAQGLLENLVEHRRSSGRVPLLVPLARTAAFTAFLESMMTTAVHRVPASWLRTMPVAPGRDRRTHDGVRVVLRGVSEAIAESGASGSLFSELGLPWAQPPTRVDIAAAEVTDVY